MLLVHVYAGGDGAFDLIEDDGITLAYTKQGAASARNTSFAWDDRGGVLSWRTAGGEAAKPIYRTVRAVLFGAGTAPVAAKERPLAPSGRVRFRRAG